MSFTDINFIFIFLPIFICIYRLVPECIRRTFLIIGSLAFYLVGTYNVFWWAILYLSEITIVEYLLYIWDHLVKKDKKTLSKIIRIVEVSLPVIVLIVGKITGYMLLGISFYTFQIISLQVDLWKKNKKVRCTEYLGFVFMFPKLLVGPISRFQTTKIRVNDDKFSNRAKALWADLEDGLLTFSFGLGLKMLLADQLATLWTSISVSGASGISTPTAWLGAITYSLELYFDFWGYSVMAIGIGKLMGITLPINFNDPYASKTVSEFWRRWHITLGAWFRDYVYIPLGGNRKGAFRTFINLLVVWLLTGLWHGNGYNFIIWGLFLFVFIALERYTFVGKLQDSKVLGHIYICLLTPISWMIFANTSLWEVWNYIKSMFGIHGQDVVIASNQFSRYILTYWYLLLIGIILCIPVVTSFIKKHKNNVFIKLALLLVFWLSVIMIAKGSSNPFMYYQF